MPNVLTTCCSRYYNGHAMPNQRGLISTQKLHNRKPTSSGCTKLWSTLTRYSLRFWQCILNITARFKILFALTLCLQDESLIATENLIITQWNTVWTARNNNVHGSNASARQQAITREVRRDLCTVSWHIGRAHGATNLGNQNLDGNPRTMHQSEHSLSAVTSDHRRPIPGTVFRFAVGQCKVCIVQYYMLRAYLHKVQSDRVGRMLLVRALLQHIK